MRTSKTQFEQIPVEEVKKIAQEDVPKKKKESGTDNLMVERSPRTRA